jgi:alkaline phosphatase
MRFNVTGLVLGLLCAGLLWSACAAPVCGEEAADSAILLIGDGMGPLQIHVARRAHGGPLAMERMPYSGIVTTHSADRAVTDSAAAATALATGYKTNNGMVGVSPDGSRLESVVERARSAGKSTGIITTDALHGGTPASFAAHVESRGDRSPIAAQVTESGVDVMLGFWKGWFLPKSAGGDREDGRDLIAEMRESGYEVVFTGDELRQAKGDRIVGLFEDDTGPSLAEMVSAALARLSKNPKGFLLIVEEARIDWECHGHDLDAAIERVRMLDAAVVTALDFAREDGATLVVVTADHETGGLQPDTTFTTGGHTGTPVRVLAFGPGGQQFSGEIDNTDVPKRMAEVVGLGSFPK